MINDQVVDSESNHYLIAITAAKYDSYAVSFVDNSTGEFRCAVLSDYQQVVNFIEQLDPQECLLDDTLTDYDFTCLVSKINTLTIERAKEEF